MIEVDSHEATDIVRWLETCVDVRVSELNKQGYADFYWTGEGLSWYPGHDGSYQVEHKTAVDVAGGADEIEEQVRREMRSHPGTYFRLLIEGSIEPAPGGGIIAYTKARGKDMMLGKHLGGRQSGLYRKVVGQIAGWNEFIEVVWSCSYVSTAEILFELYTRDQRPEDERTTFRRYFKDRPSWNPNLQVMRLMGSALNDCGIGPGLADRIIAAVGTNYNALTMDPKDIAARVKGVSEGTLRQFQRKNGRVDV